LAPLILTLLPYTTLFRSLEKNGLLGAAGALEEREILHVARANLDDVGVFFDELERFVVDSFGDDAETMLGAHFRENLEAAFAESLKAVRGSTRFVSAAAKQPRARLFDALGNRSEEHTSELQSR